MNRPYIIRDKQLPTLFWLAAERNGQDEVIGGPFTLPDGVMGSLAMFEAIERQRASDFQTGRVPA